MTPQTRYGRGPIQSYLLPALIIAKHVSSANNYEVRSLSRL